MEDISRRSILIGGCALLALGATALPAAAQTAVRKLPDGRLEVMLAKIPQLATIGGAVSIGTIKSEPVAVARTGPSNFKAFSLRCPHQGITVTRSANGWTCEAHGSQFKADGNLILGPATNGLARVALSVRKGKAIVG